MKTFQKPDFIHVGPTKTGTTWLHTHLSEHPEVWLPSVKEVRYYWGHGRKTGNNDSAYRKFKQGLLGNLNYAWRIMYAKRRRHEMRQNPASLSLSRVMWDLKYIFLPQSPGWYSSLFRSDRVAGDITPGYYVFDKNEIGKMRDRLPDLRILISLRDPVERLWSDARMHLLAVPGKDFEDVPDTVFFRRFDTVHERCPSYVEFVGKWRDAFGDNLKVTFYDDLKTDPVAYFHSICDFLEIQRMSDAELEPRLGNKVWEGVKTSLPDHFRDYLVKKCQPCIRELAESGVSHHAGTWLDKYSQITQDKNPVEVKDVRITKE